MLMQDFEGIEYGYTFNIETGVITLYTRGEIKPVSLDKEEADIFRKQMELINTKQDKTLFERTERLVQIHYYFKTKPCPMPQFVE